MGLGLDGFIGLGLVGFIGFGLGSLVNGINVIGLVGLIGFIGLVGLVSFSINGLIGKRNIVNSLQFEIEMKQSQHDLFWRESWLWCVGRVFSSLAGLDSVFENALQNSTEVFFDKIPKMTKYCIMRECENIHSWISLSGDLVFSHQQGIHGFKLPKRFWRSLPEISLLLFSLLLNESILKAQPSELMPFLFACVWLNALQAVRHSNRYDHHRHLFQQQASANLSSNSSQLRCHNQQSRLGTLV
jgi:hypothetical protein